MKRILFALLALAFCLTMLPVTIPAEASTHGLLTYEIADGEVTITGCEKYVCDTVVIPTAIEGYPVTAIQSSAFYQCILLPSVVIPESVRYIGSKAFYGCSQLKSIYFRSHAPEFGLSRSMCYDHEDNPWEDLDFDFSAEHEYGPFESVYATVYYPDTASGWDQVTSQTMTGRGCGDAAARGKLTLQKITLSAVSGSITAYGQGAVSLELTSDKTEDLSVTVTDQSYRLEDLLPGEYTLRVSQPGAVTRTYTVTLREGENLLDLKLHTPGDLNGNGRHDVGDVAQIYSHVKSVKPLTGYALLCAECTGDGRVTVGDTSKVYNQVLGN